MSGKSIDAADKFRDAMNELTKSFQSFVADTGIINHLKEVTDELAALKKMKDGFAEKNNVILKDDFLRDARNRQIERTDKLPPDSEERKAAMREGLSNAMETRSYDEMGLGRGISAEDYKKYKEMFKNGATSYSPPVTPEDLNKANADKAAKEAADAKAAQIRADAQALSISQEQVKSIMKTLDGREKEKKAVEDIVGEMQNQIKMQDLIAQGKEKEAFIQNEIYKAQKSHADIPMTDEQRKGIADAPIKMPANERQAFIEGEFDKFNKSRPANTLTPDESKNISGLADQIYTGKSNQATSDALKEMRDQLNLQLLINAGKGKQAFIDEQLAKLAKERGEALTDTLREDPKFKEMSDLSGKLYDSKNGIDVKTETPQVDQLAKIGGYSFGGEMNKSLDVERNSLLKQIAAKVGLPVIQEVLT